MALSDLVRSAWNEPRPSGPRSPNRGDWVLLAIALTLGVVETNARSDVPWSSAIVGLATLCTLPWRRSLPLLMVVIAFGTSFATNIVDGVTGQDGPTLNTTAFLLLLPYAVFRWGSGKELILGAPFMLGAATVDVLFDQVSMEDLIGAYAVLAISMTLGTTIRFRARDRAREIEQVKLREREQIARDLHDTVAHHVSAIAIRAQAGLAAAPADSGAAVDALRVIGEEASRTLADMRAMVGALRQDEPAQLAPNPTLADLERLADSSPDGPDVSVDVAGDVEDLPASVTGALYRLAQESVTNARRHAKNATRIWVRVTAKPSEVRLEVRDDGEPVPPAAPEVGFGLVGMRERAELLGGTCRAGPAPGGGWTVTASLPKTGQQP